MMRILVVSQMYPRRSAPTFAAFIRRQTEALAEAGHDVTVLAPMMHAPWPLWFNERWYAHGQTAKSASYKNVLVHWPTYWSPPGMRLHFVEGHTMWLGLKPLRHSLAERKFDIIHANRLFPEGLAALELGKQLGIPVVCMARGMDLNLIPSWGWAYRRALKKVIGEADGILSVSKAFLADLEPIARPACPTAVVYNGVDPLPAASREEKRVIRQKYGLPEEGVLAGYVGRLEPDKGTPELLRAAGGAMRANRELLLAAVGEVRSESYRVDVQRMHCKDRIFLLGPKTYAETRELMRAFDLFVFPSRLEGVPNAVLEAMSCGVPVVATLAGGTGEVVDGGAGLLSPVGDVRRFEHNLLRVSANEALRKRMGEAGMRHVAKHFSWYANARGLTEFYARLLGVEEMEMRKAAA
jgi:glycosyltransferase involved in cell wall biosynthesis